MHCVQVNLTQRGVIVRGVTVTDTIVGGVGGAEGEEEERLAEQRLCKDTN